nr:MAG TPA: hypothetical protein [Caudoviricetes sp.]
MEPESWGYRFRQELAGLCRGHSPAPSGSAG